MSRWDEPRDDDQLLSALGEALRPTVDDRAEPSFPELVAFRRAVAGAGGAAVAPMRRRMWPRVGALVAVAAAVLGLLLVNAGGDIGRHGRTKLDVAQEQLVALRTAVAGGDTAAIEKAADAAEAAIRALPLAEQAALASQANQLLAEADRLLGSPTTYAPIPTTSSTSTSTTPTTRPARPRTTVAPAVVPTTVRPTPTAPPTTEGDHPDTEDHSSGDTSTTESSDSQPDF